MRKHPLTAAARADFVHGYGTILAQELALEIRLRHLATSPPVDEDATGILFTLRRHLETVDLIVTLLGMHCALLPIPRRFHASLRRRPVSNGPLREAASPEANDLVALAAAHHTLATRLHDIGRRPLEGQRLAITLREIAYNHQRMSNVLLAMVGEDRRTDPATRERVSFHVARAAAQRRS